MKINEINPFLRFAGHPTPSIVGQFNKLLCACDHRLFVIDSGEARILAGEREYVVRSGGVLFIRSGVLYRYLSFSEDFSMYSFNFDMTRRYAEHNVPIPPDNAELCRRTVLEGGEYTVEELGCVLYVTDGEAPAIAARIEREYRHASLYYDVRCGHLLADLLALTLRSAVRNDMPKAVRLVSEVTGYIREHYAEECDNESICRHFSYHPNYINRLMVEHTGMSLHQYVNRTRVGKALALLESGAYPVSEIALLVGFSDPAHFSKTFRKCIGCSPSAYRPKK